MDIEDANPSRCSGRGIALSGFQRWVPPPLNFVVRQAFIEEKGKWKRKTGKQKVVSQHVW
jgi:hypothetical protein